MNPDKDTTTPSEEKEEKPLDPQEIHTASIEQILASDDGEEWENSEEKPKEETVLSTEPPQEIVPEEKVETPSAPVIDSNKISQQVAEQVVQALTGGEPQTPDEEKRLEELYKEAVKDEGWVKEGRNPTYPEFARLMTKLNAPLIKDQVIKELKTEQEQEQKKVKDEQEAVVKAQEEADAHYSKNWNTQLDELTSSGKIPAIKDRANKEDPGVKARVELLTMLQDEFNSRTAQGLPPVEDLRVIYYEKYAPKYQGNTNREVPGAKAPVFGANQAVGQTDSDNYSYQEISSSSVYDLLGGK